jgi:glycosyltransferase involved in cell wall biosynthesis
MPSISELPPPPTGRTGWPWTAEGEQLPATRPDGTPWPKISIVTPSFNQAEYLETTIRSILLQGYPNLEYIIMDGGSSDGSLEIIRKYERWIAYWKSEPDGGQYAAVQKGFEHSSGEVMAWLNSDDLYFPWTLKTAGELFGRFSNIEWLTTSNMAATAPDGKSISFFNRKNFSRGWFYKSLQPGKSRGAIQQESTFWRSTLWKKAGNKMDEHLYYAGDFELWARFFEHAILVTTNTPLGIFRYHKGQKISMIHKYIEEANEVIKKKHVGPIWTRVPVFLLMVMRYPLKRLYPNVNWFGTRCDKVRFDPVNNRWIYTNFFV